MGVAVNTIGQSKRGGGGRGDTERLDTMPSTNGKAAHIRARWIEGEALRQLRFGLTYRQIASVLTALARGEMTPTTAGIDLPPDVTFPPGYSINHQRVFELVKHALDRFPMLEAQALRTLWMTRYEEAWESRRVTTWSVAGKAAAHTPALLLVIFSSVHCRQRLAGKCGSLGRPCFASRTANR